MESFRLKITNTFLTLKNTYTTLSPERVIVFWSLVFFSCVLFFAALIAINVRFTDVVPTLGGTVREGVIGTPRFINPVLATSDQDLDMVALVFAGLTKKEGTGSIVLDLAESITESEDKLHYDIILKQRARFHDGEPVTSDDVIYTISLIQNPAIKSPHRVLFEGVTIDKVSDREFTVNLKKPFPLVMQAFTVGIVPKHVWKNLTDEQISLSDYNIHAIGSGPFMIEGVRTDSGIPVSFLLKAHESYTLGRPHLDSIELFMYQNEKYLTQAFNDGDIDRLHGISPEKISTLSIATTSVQTSLLPRTFTVFFNPNKADFLSDKKVRQALNLAINKEAIVQEILQGYGYVIETPYPFDLNQPKAIFDKEKARALLLESKYMKNASSTLTIDIATANTPEMKAVADRIKTDWADIGVTVNVLVYEFADLNQTIIKERDYEALLFGTLTRTPSDLYAFWHSSQRAYPGLNISNYVSNKLDKNLTTLREDDNELNRVTAYDSVRSEFMDEVPGIFLYAPSLIYVANDNVTSPLPLFSIDNSSRFLLVNDWYRYTERVWKFAHAKNIESLLTNIIH
jgi:peptide/nickel transport system substrate-binding protein